MGATIREVQHGSEDYRRLLAMRHAILRAPLGLDWSADDLAGEDEQLHFGLFGDGDALVGCVVVKVLGDGTAKVRQMAIAAGARGRGNGRRLIEGMEEALRGRGIRRVEMDARKIAGGFYEKLGYRVEGGEFLQVTIPHVRMVKDL